ncbi:hypothetical protein ACH5RR_037562 [Cinchona calisaya]|uniref:Uncharacterized protein n=1 Tax=Cinchona calisaya TaxID=153742 RepID=A0ABD2Y6K0_9GENT
MKRRAAALVVLTSDMAVQARLHQLGEPITLFAADFRIWVELEVYGQFSAVEYFQATRRSVLRYVRDEDGAPMPIVEEEYVEPVPGQRRIYATMRAAIEWRGAAGPLIDFQDDQWLSVMPSQAVEIFISPGEQRQPLVIQIPLPPAW